MKKWFSIITPCVIAALISTVAIGWGLLKMSSTERWSLVVAIVFTPLLVASVVIDLIVKYFFKQQPLYIWALEIMALFLLFLLTSMLN